MLETHSLISLMWTLIRLLLTFLFEKQINSFSPPPEADMNFLKLQEEVLLTSIRCSFQSLHVFTVKYTFPHAAMVWRVWREPCCLCSLMNISDCSSGDIKCQKNIFIPAVCIGYTTAANLEPESRNVCGEKKRKRSRSS